MSVVEEFSLLQTNKLFRDGSYAAAIEKYSVMAESGYLPEICYTNMALAYLNLGKLNDASKAAYSLYARHPLAKPAIDVNAYLNFYYLKTHQGPCLSIIVPVYNSGKYLEKCLDSIVRQSFSDFEIIIVNDGSTDNSAEIISKYSSKDERIKVIENRKASGNPGTPRNQALDICQGLYIGFVDSDDWLDENYYAELMRKTIDSSPDIVFSGGFKNCLSNGDVTIRQYNNDGFNESDSKRYKFHDSFMIWDKVFHRRLIKTFDLKLGETPAAVDVPFIFKAYYYCASVAYANDLIGYNYRRESDSSVTVAHRKNSNCDFEFESYNSVLKWSFSTGITAYYNQIIYIKMVNSLLYTLSLVNSNHFSNFLFKVKLAFSQVDKESFKKFCIDNKKFWLYKEFLKVSDGSEAEVIEFILDKKRKADEKRYKAITEPRFVRKAKNKGILFFPAWIGNNPYQKMLYEAINEKFDILVSGHAKEALCERFLQEKRAEFDYIHLHWLHAFIDPSQPNGADKLVNVLNYAKSIGYKIIYTAHNIVSHDAEYAENEVKLRRQVAKFFDYALVHGDKGNELLVETIKFNPSRIYKVPHGSYGDYYGTLVDKNAARAEFGLASDTTVFLFFGNIKGYKGLGNLLKAFERVYQTSKKIALLVAGNLVDEQSKDLVREYANHPGIKFRTGYVEDALVKHLFSAADYTVLPFKRILTSGSAVLSLTFACPVIAPNDGILPEFVTNGLGYLFDDYAEMEMIMRNIANKKLSVLPNAELSNFNNKYAWSNCVTGMSSIFAK